MPTLQQLLKKTPRIEKTRRSDTPALNGCPQKKATCLKVYHRSPKKPNSAVRKVAKVRLSNSKKVIVYIPGEDHSVPEHAAVLIRGGKTKDLPGLKYKIIRGVLDAKSVVGRTRGRSRYGTKKPEIKEAAAEK